MSSSRGGYSGSRGSQSYSISRNGASHSQGRRRSRGRISENEVDSLPVMLPACGCTLPMKAYISHTYANQGRRFWRCRNWNNKVSLCTYNVNYKCIDVLWSCFFINCVLDLFNRQCIPVTCTSGTMISYLVLQQ